MRQNGAQSGQMCKFKLRQPEPGAKWSQRRLHPPISWIHDPTERRIWQFFIAKVEHCEFATAADRIFKTFQIASAVILYTLWKMTGGPY